MPGLRLSVMSNVDGPVPFSEGGRIIQWTRLFSWIQGTISSIADLQAPTMAMDLMSGSRREGRRVAKSFEWMAGPLKELVGELGMEGRREIEVWPVERRSLSAYKVSPVDVVMSHPFPWRAMLVTVVFSFTRRRISCFSA